jgi:DNA-binding transcriptional MerR regulator
MEKSPDAFRTISEVADWLGVPAHVLRFWESRFTQVKPVKRAGGRRYYRPADMELLGGIKRLLHDDGMTIRGVQKLLRENGVKHVQSLSPPLYSEIEDAELVEGSPGAGEGVVAFDRPADMPSEEAPREPAKDRAEPAPAAATDDAGAPEAAAVQPPEEAPAPAPAVAAEENGPQPVPVAADEPEDVDHAEDIVEAPAAEAAETPAPPEVEDEDEAALEALEDERSAAAARDLFDQPAAPPAVAPPALQPVEDLPLDDEDIEDDLLEPTLSTASRLLVLGDAGLAAHGPAIAGAHDRLVALRDRMSHRD